MSIVLSILIMLSISCGISNSSIEKSKETISRFYHKLNTSDNDSLSTIFSYKFMEKDSAKEWVNEINNGRKVWGAFKNYEFTGVRYSTKNCQLTAYVHYANQVNVEKFVLVSENDTMKIIYFAINP